VWLAPGQARAEALTPPGALIAPERVDRLYIDALSRRIERLLPVLMGSLSEVRRVREPALIRCFDRAVSALHGVGRQLRYHAERWESEPSATERTRHARALLLLDARVQELSLSTELCFTDGIALAPGETHVSVEVRGAARARNPARTQN
jgi:hypothetical protein